MYVGKVRVRRTVDIVASSRDRSVLTVQKTGPIYLYSYNARSICMRVSVSVDGSSEDLSQMFQKLFM